MVAKVVLPEEEGPLSARMMGRDMVVVRGVGGGGGSGAWGVEEEREEGKVMLEGEGGVIWGRRSEQGKKRKEGG